MDERLKEAIFHYEYEKSKVPPEIYGDIDYMIEQAERVPMLETSIKRNRNRMKKLEKENYVYKLRGENAQDLNEVVIKPLIEQNKRYKQALKFYKDGSGDSGYKARQALRGESE